LQEQLIAVVWPLRRKRIGYLLRLFLYGESLLITKENFQYFFTPFTKAHAMTDCVGNEFCDITLSGGVIGVVYG
jgi:hypothetical protein